MLEQWEMGVPDRIVEVTDASWQWAGPWQDAARGRDGQAGTRASRDGDAAPRRR